MTPPLDRLRSTLYLEEVGGQKRLVFAGTSRNGGLEVAGDLARLVELQRPRL